MRRVNRIDPPQILSDNYARWTEEIINEFNRLGSWNALEKKRDDLISNYRHDEIKEQLNRFCFHKCVYCEREPENEHVEHFYPKSLYPCLTFLWENLLIACGKCNSNKSTLDTRLEPIIDPSIEEPSDYLVFENYVLVDAPRTPDRSKSKKTRVKLRLNRQKLLKSRGRIMKQLLKDLTELQEKIDLFYGANTPLKTTHRRNKLRNWFQLIEETTNEEEEYCGFCLSILENSSIFNEARYILSIT